MITQASNLNLIPERSVPVIVHVSQFDVGSRTLSFKLYNGSTGFTLPSGATAKIQGLKKDGNVFEYPMTISGSTVSVDVADQMTVIAGEVRCMIVLSHNNQILGTANFILQVERAPIDEGTMSDSNIPAIVTLIHGGNVGQVLSWGENGAEWTDNGSGDMNKATYDTNDDGIVDNAEKVNGKTVDRDVLANEYTNSQIDGAIQTIANAVSQLGGEVVKKVNNVAPVAGNVALTKADIGLGNVDNTSDANKPISTATQAALANQKYFYIDSEGYGCINYDLFQTA